MILRYIVHSKGIEVVDADERRPHRMLAVTADGSVITRHSVDGRVITMLSAAEARLIVRTIRSARWRRLLGRHEDPQQIRSQIARAYGITPSDRGR